MIGLIIGDIVGSVYEHHPIKTKEFTLFQPYSRFTDDTVLALAVAHAVNRTTGIAQSLLDIKGQPLVFREEVQRQLTIFAKAYPKAGYGRRFNEWVYASEQKPYHSYGNGAPMRVAAIAMIAGDEDYLRHQVYEATRVTHNHEESFRAAEAIAFAIYYSRRKVAKEKIKSFIQEHYYPLDFKLDDIRETYQFDVSSQGSVPQALQCFFESYDFEDAIRNAISLGGDADTLASMAGSMAGAYYKIPISLVIQAKRYLTEELYDVLDSFESRFRLHRQYAY